MSHLFDISCCFLLFDCFCFIYVWFRFFFADTLTKFSDTTWANGALSLGIYNAFGKGLALGRHKVMTSVAMTVTVPAKPILLSFRSNGAMATRFVLQTVFLL